MTKIDPATTALVLIDLQTRIVALETVPIEGTEVVANAVLLREAFSAAGSTIVHVRAHRPGVEEQPPGSELVAELTPRDGEHLITKNTIGAFYRTGLDELLRGLGVKTLVLAGIATEYGVESTLRAAIDHDYETIAVSDAMAGIAAISHESAVTKVFPRLGEVLTTAETAAALGWTMIDKIAWLHLRDGRILSTRSRGKSVFYLPGGKRESGETDAETLIREIREELTVEIDPASIEPAGVFEAQADGHATGLLVRMTCYTAEFGGTLTASSEIDEVAWLGYEDRDRVSAVDKIIFDHLRETGLLR
ncbi:nicotinamidase-related amidase [Amycolatopsis roodepoortensis]|uniref:Nicotinamidase-related amidase n=2 Tax=Amycolatopsis roodepoortensis TaxID=700274 RepID=A0ABR9L656_9PSEU|nr:nicotinamidase-related amidase [Amycolatopsis roodepoortensis]